MKKIAEHFAKAYGIQSYTFDGMDFFNCYAGFRSAFDEVRQTGRPVLIEAVTERFRGHSISDPAVYRSKEELTQAKSRDPIQLFAESLKKAQLLSDAQFDALEKEQKECVKAAMKFAEESPLPDPMTLEEDVFAP